MKCWRIIVIVSTIFIIITGVYFMISEKNQLNTFHQSMGKHSNHLSNEKSPYLLQHADNPVDWYPWGTEAFEKAKREDKPIFLSIGYSTCHWCHVMEHESFEDEETARLMNDAFICIKVDREERPDIDNIYMTVCQMMTGSGGWPLTIFMTPDKKPFFAGTYIPKESKWGRSGLMDLIPKIRSLWTDEKDKLLESADEITSHLNQINSTEKTGTLDMSIFANAYNYFSSNFDSTDGGFGNSHKFPTPHNFLFLLRYWKQFDDSFALKMVETTLKKMRMGGIFDHIGFGFHRYSTDTEWLVPHFEKMLYDQAMISMACMEAFQATGDEIYSSTARETFAYVLRDMTSENGGFCSAEDADSEGIEGKFYVWDAEEIESILGEKDAEFAMKVFNINKAGNFKDEATGEKTEQNIFHLTKSYSEIADESGISTDELEKRISSIRKKLFKKREERVHPGKDDKILTDWNGLMIAALAQAGRIFNNPEYIKAAEKGISFIKEKMLKKNNRLLHRYRKGDAAIKGNLDDYAFTTWGLIELYETTFKADYLKLAIEITEAMIKHFEDDKNGGFYFSPDDGEKLLIRPIEFHDGAVPSGNSVAFYNFIRLFRITADLKWENYANKISNRAAASIKKIPAGHTMFLVGLQMATGQPLEIILAGKQKDNALEQMLIEINSRFIPNKVVLFHPADEKNPLIQSLAPYIKTHKMIDGRATAYLCRDYACLQPASDVEEFVELLSKKF